MNKEAGKAGKAGKGDKPRKVKIKKYDDNYEDINWNSKKIKNKKNKRI